MNFIFLIALVANPVINEIPSNLSINDIKELYRQIRLLALNPGKILKVDSCIVQKDAAEFVFESGQIYFFEPVNERVIGAFFKGKGLFKLRTDDTIERQQIRRFTGEDFVEQEFGEALLLFADRTHQEIISDQGTSAAMLDTHIIDAGIQFRETVRERFIWNIDARILSDLVAGPSGQFFVAFLECPEEKHFLFVVDPSDEEAVSLIRYEPIKYSKRVDIETWYSSRFISLLQQPEPTFDIKTTHLDCIVDSRQVMKATANLEFVSLIDSARVVPIILSPFLRVESVILGNADTCSFIQEDEKKDGELWITFPSMLKKDSTYELTFVYSSDEIMEDVGGDNFVVRERDSWYPSFYADAHEARRFLMKFGVPKDMTLLGTGSLLRRLTENDLAYSEWDSKVEYRVAGFNYGKFSKVTQKSSKCVVDCYTNTKLSDDLLELRRAFEQNPELQAAYMLLPQELTTDGIGKNAAIESHNAYEVYTQFFGEIAIRNITVSQQPQTQFGQSWPSLIFLPFTAFFNESLRERLELIRSEQTMMWYEALASHEIAHQWWGHTIAADSYHDEWLEEGFARYSSALYLQVTEGVDLFKDYMNMLRDQILTKVEDDRSANALGPIWLGERLSSLKVPYGRSLVYNKGAFVLHMLRMMLFDYEKKSDERFINMIRDFVKTYTGKTVRTEDFKKVVDKHFGQNMDWFFKQWVYGTEMPTYRYEYGLEENSDGTCLLAVNVEQGGVSESFTMPLHFLVNFDEGYAVLEMKVKGSGVTVKQFRLPSKPKSIEPTPWYGVLGFVTK